MGSGIAQACAQAGYEVHLNDSSKEAVKKALSNMEWSLSKLESKKVLQESASTVLGRIKIEDDINFAASADWVIETISEIKEKKLPLFEKLDSLVPVNIPLATNTSTIPISQIAEVTANPQRVVGVHFFNPVPLMGLIEIIKGNRTSDEIFESACQFAISLGKRPVRVYKDIPGFVFNRIWGSTVKEAVDLVAQGIVSPEDVDFGMRAGYGWKRGPFEMADEAGVDTYANSVKSFKLLGEEDLSPKSDLLDNMVKKGYLGKKTGRGFYIYDEKKKDIA